jgi:outer membrane protein OmpA-like peptidoglycan-associated protein
MRHGMRLGIVAVLSILGAGCATEELTVALFSKRQAEVDEKLAEHGQRIDRVEDRVAHLEITVTETRDQLFGPLAASPMGTARTVTPWQPARSGPDPAARTDRMLVAVVHVPFGFNRADLDVNAEAALASILKQVREQAGVTLELEGTTDAVGGYDYNLRLSQRRVAAVKRWLIQNGVNPARIIGATSRGPLDDPSLKDSAKRRVMVKVNIPPGQ